MLGRLFQSAASTFATTSRPQTPLESVTEDQHTRNLLFPDPSLLRSGLATAIPGHNVRIPVTGRDASNFDASNDIIHPTEIRIIVAQDANARHHQPQILYDSNAIHRSSPRQVASPQDATPLTSRKSSTRGKSNTSPIGPLPRRHRAQTPQSSISISASPFLASSPTSPPSPDSRFRSPFGDRSRFSPFEPIADVETTHGRITREAKEETDGLLGCMFGPPGFRLDPGIKLHVMPKESIEGPGLGNAATGTRSPVCSRPLSSGGFARKKTPLVRSTSAADVNHNGLFTDAVGPLPHAKSSIMFTSLFSVQLQQPPLQENRDPSGDSTTDSPLSRLQRLDSDSNTAHMKQKRAPMYAVSIILQLPNEYSPGKTRSTIANGLSSLSSSYNDTLHGSSWRTDSSIFSSFMEIRAHGLFGTDSTFNHQISQVLMHWNIISRCLQHLEVVAKAKLIDLLGHAIPLVPLLSAVPARDPTKPPKKSKPATQHSIHLESDALQNDAAFQKEISLTELRLTSGLKIRKVVTGQGRWGAWREEARWIGRTVGGKEQSFFFFNLLTSFLGYNTTWLDTIDLPHKRKGSWPRSSKARNGTKLTQRTVIISADKMVARRLVFVLAAFLPNAHPVHHTHFSPMPRSPHPGFAYSESPPCTTITRDPSLRRTLNHRPSTFRKPMGERRGHARSVSFSLLGLDGETSSSSAGIPDQEERRGSDSHSIQSVVIPTPLLDSRKASSSTIMADSAIPVPHFATASVHSPGKSTPEQRKSSVGSIASQALTHTLMRSESNTSANGSGGRWGSVVSGFWSNRRDSLTDDSEVLGTSQDGVGEAHSFRSSQHAFSPNKLSRMVREASEVIVDFDAQPRTGTLSSSPRKPLSLEQCLKKPLDGRERASPARSIPQRPKTERLPLQLSLNEDEGYIDIKLPPNHSFNSSLASSFASSLRPFDSSATAGASGSSFTDHFSPYGFPAAPDSPRPSDHPAIDVGGWLKAFHPDLALQAVKPYDALQADIKHAMLAEAALLPRRDEDQDMEHESTTTGATAWHDICTTLIADAASYSISCLRLQRRRLQAAPASAPASTPASDSISASTKTPNPSHNTGHSAFLPTHEDRIISQPIMDLDATLIDAVERLLAHSDSSSRVPSHTPSRVPSPSHSRTGSMRAKSTSSTTAISQAPIAIKIAAHAYPAHGVSGAMTMPPMLELGSGLGLSLGMGTGTGMEMEMGSGMGMAWEGQHGSFGEGPQAECRRVVLGALADVVRSVCREQDGSTTRSGVPDSTLREGVRRWLGSIGDSQVMGSRG